jgi:hypothetical protein
LQFAKATAKIREIGGNGKREKKRLKALRILAQTDGLGKK